MSSRQEGLKRGILMLNPCIGFGMKDCTKSHTNITPLSKDPERIVTVDLNHTAPLLPPI